MGKIMNKYLLFLVGKIKRIIKKKMNTNTKNSQLAVISFALAPSLGVKIFELNNRWKDEIP